MVITIPPAEPHTHTVVFLHGRGDNARQFAESLHMSTDSHRRALPEIFPTFRWVFPQAEVRPCAALHGNLVSQWFDVWDSRDLSAQEELQIPGLRESVVAVRRLLAAEAAALGGRWDRVVLAGISQGAQTAAHTLLNLNIAPPRPRPVAHRHPPPDDASSASPAQTAASPSPPSASHPPAQPPEPAPATTSRPPPSPPQPPPPPRRLAGFIGFCARMPLAGRSLADTRKILDLDDVPDDDELVRHTPVLLEHCANDDLVPVETAEVLRDTLAGFGAHVTWRLYPVGGHWLNSPAGIEDVVAFIREHVLPPDPAARRIH